MIKNSHKEHWIVRMENKEMEERRLDYIDVAKGIGILLMILGHVGFYGSFDRFIHAFHMPLFFFISGYLYKIRGISWVDYIKKKAKTMLLPYVIIGLFHYIVWLLIHARSSGNKLEPLINLLWINTNDQMPIAGALWFLTCLFIIEVLFFAIKKIIKNEIVLAVICLFVGIIGMLFPCVISTRLPWAADSALVGIMFYYLGYLIHKQEGRKGIRKIMNFSIGEILILLLLFSLSSLLNADVNMRTGDYALVPWTLINAVGMTVLTINLSKKIRLKTMQKMLCYVGKNSIVFLCFNQLIIYIVRKMTDIFSFFSISLLTRTIERALIAVVSTALLVMISEMITKTRLRVIFGKQK